MTSAVGHPLDRMAPLAPAMTRLDPAPRRLTTAALLRVLDAGGPGRPIMRHGVLGLLALSLALATVLPDAVYSRVPAFQLEVVGASTTYLPAILEPVGDALPASVRGHVGTFRMPSGEAISGPISPAEFQAIQAGQQTLLVHMVGEEGEHGRPVSGLWALPRMAVAALLCLLGLGFALSALRRVRARWWIGRLAGKGVETVGRTTELKVKRLLRGERPVGWLFTVYFQFRAGERVVESTVEQQYSERFVPFTVGSPLRVLYDPVKPERAIPADLVPLAPRDR